MIAIAAGLVSGLEAAAAVPVGKKEVEASGFAEAFERVSGDVGRGLLKIAPGEVKKTDAAGGGHAKQAGKGGGLPRGAAVRAAAKGAEGKVGAGVVVPPVVLGGSATGSVVAKQSLKGGAGEQAVGIELAVDGSEAEVETSADAGGGPVFSDEVTSGSSAPIIAKGLEIGEAAADGVAPSTPIDSSRGLRTDGTLQPVASLRDGGEPALSGVEIISPAISMGNVAEVSARSPVEVVVGAAKSAVANPSGRVQGSLTKDLLEGRQPAASAVGERVRAVASLVVEESAAIAVDAFAFRAGVPPSTVVDSPTTQEAPVGTTGLMAAASDPTANTDGVSSVALRGADSQGRREGVRKILVQDGLNGVKVHSDSGPKGLPGLKSGAHATVGAQPALKASADGDVSVADAGGAETRPVAVDRVATSELLQGVDSTWQREVLPVATVPVPAESKKDGDLGEVRVAVASTVETSQSIGEGGLRTLDPPADVSSSPASARAEAERGDSVRTKEEGPSGLRVEAGLSSTVTTVGIGLADVAGARDARATAVTQGDVGSTAAPEVVRAKTDDDTLIVAGASGEPRRTGKARPDASLLVTGEVADATKGRRSEVAGELVTRSFGSSVEERPNGGKRGVDADLGHPTAEATIPVSGDSELPVAKTGDTSAVEVIAASVAVQAGPEQRAVTGPVAVAAKDRKAAAPVVKANDAPRGSGEGAVLLDVAQAGSRAGAMAGDHRSAPLDNAPAVAAPMNAVDHAAAAVQMSAPQVASVSVTTAVANASPGVSIAHEVRSTSPAVGGESLVSPLPHTTLEATPTVLEIGVPGGTHGWLKIRAEIGESGTVQASMSATTHAGQETLRREMPALNAFLDSEHVPVSVQVAHGLSNGGTPPVAESGGLNLGSGMSQNPESGAGRSQAEAGAGPAPGGDGRGEREGRQADGALDGRRPVDAVVQSASQARDSEWTTSSTYGGGGSMNGGSWLNVMA